MICQNKECSQEFEPKTHNQKYHSDECCRMATNKRIMEKYYEKKSIKNGLVRNCTKCKTKLSRYNNSDICSVCEKNIIEHSKKAIWNLLNELS